MNLSPDILRATYAYLRALPPFSRWRLPKAEEMKSSVRGSRDEVTIGRHQAPIKGSSDCHEIRVSRRKISHTANLIQTMAHEIVHVAVDIHHPEDRSSNGANFKRRAAQVCKIHGFDELYF